MTDLAFRSMKKQIKSNKTVAAAALMRDLLSLLKFHKRMGMKKIWKVKMQTGAEAAMTRHVLSLLNLHSRLRMKTNCKETIRTKILNAVLKLN